MRESDLHSMDLGIKARASLARAKSIPWLGLERGAFLSLGQWYSRYSRARVLLG